MVKNRQNFLANGVHLLEVTKKDKGKVSVDITLVTD